MFILKRKRCEHSTVGLVDFCIRCPGGCFRFFGKLFHKWYDIFGKITIGQVLSKFLPSLMFGTRKPGFYHIQFNRTSSIIASETMIVVFGYVGRTFFIPLFPTTMRTGKESFISSGSYYWNRKKGHYVSNFDFITIFAHYVPLPFRFYFS